MFIPDLGQADQAAPASSRLPAPPPHKSSLFDKEHRRQTLLTLGASLASGQTFGEGLSTALGNLAGLQGNLSAEQRKQHQLGGPDDSFEITTDPVTGERSYAPVPAFQSYLRDKARLLKPRDSADLNGRAMAAIEQLDEAKRPAAYAAMLQHPEYYGIAPENMPPSYDPQYAANTAHMGMTVAQAQARATASANAESLRAARETAAADRGVRTDAFVQRSRALTNQGQQRIGISAAKAKSSGARGGKAKTSPHNSDLSYLLQ